MEVNQKELASILGITDRRVRQLKTELGLFTSERAMVGDTKNKRYVLEVCIPEYINYRLDVENERGTVAIKEREQAEHERIKKKISQLKLRKLKRELHYAVDVENFLVDMLIKFKNHLLTLPQKVAPLIVGEDDIAIVLSVLEKEVYSTLEELSEYDPMKIDNEDVYTTIDDNEEDEDDED